MKEKPILFNGDMVNAILEGRKTQTRRLNGFDNINKEPDGYVFDGLNIFDENLYACYTDLKINNSVQVKFPYGQFGDHLWVRETWQGYRQTNIEYDEWEEMKTPKDRHEDCYSPVYKADNKFFPEKWFPSIYMPREFSRIDLLIKDIRVERLQDISEEDAIAEGVSDNIEYYGDDPTGYNLFKALWHQINGAESWDENPWVWVIDFERIEK